jgi:hypothetical protein
MPTLNVTATDTITVADIFGGVGQVWVRIRKWAERLFMDSQPSTANEEQPDESDTPPTSVPDPPTLGIKVSDEINTEDDFGG